MKRRLKNGNLTANAIKILQQTPSLRAKLLARRLLQVNFFLFLLLCSSRFSRNQIEHVDNATYTQSN